VWDAAGTSSIADRLPQLPGLVASEGSGRTVNPDRAEFAQQIRSSLADIDPTTGYLRG
jgi:hypothetical protein